MVYFVGAGSGDPDLITMKGYVLLQKADVVVWAGSLVNPKLLMYTKAECRVFDSAKMTLEQTNEVLVSSSNEGKICVRLHTGDPSLYGAIREQMELLDRANVKYEVVPGVSSFCGAAAALKKEYTVPGVSQTLIISRLEGRTPVPEREKLASLASHGSSMALFLSSGMIGSLVKELLAGGTYTPQTPAAVVYKATWADQKVVFGTLGDIEKKAFEAHINKTALILVGDFLGDKYEVSKLYDPAFSTEFRKAGVKTVNISDFESGRRISAAEDLNFSRICVVCFSARGKSVMDKIAMQIVPYCKKNPSIKTVCCYGEKHEKLSDVCKQAFNIGNSDGQKTLLVFVGSTGIAVRSIAPYIKKKAEDPAVVVIDDNANFCIPVLSGHIGGANSAAAVLSRITGAQCAVTTSTDNNKVWAVDNWAIKNNLEISNPSSIVKISGALLSGKKVLLKSKVELSRKVLSDIPFCYEKDGNYEIYPERKGSEDIACTKSSIVVSYNTVDFTGVNKNSDLILIPKMVVLGIGCKKDTDPKALQSFVKSVLESEGIDIRAVCTIASIDVKKDESALFALSQKLNVPFVYYGADRLNALKGDFSSSEFVNQVTGTDCVCERACVCAAGGDYSSLIVRKTSKNGMTLACAVLSELK